MSEQTVDFAELVEKTPSSEDLRISLELYVPCDWKGRIAESESELVEVAQEWVRAALNLKQTDDEFSQRPLYPMHGVGFGNVRVHQKED